MKSQAHNFKGYDRYFILEELYKQHVTNLQQIVNVVKILCLELPNVKFIDSMNFFPMALSNFPKTFRIDELKKGFFPHFFNTQQNQIYVGTCLTNLTTTLMVCPQHAKMNSINGMTKKYLKDTFLISNVNC